MKIEVKITDDNGTVHNHIINETKFSEKSIQKASEKYRKTTTNNMAIEQIAFIQGALWFKNILTSKK